MQGCYSSAMTSCSSKREEAALLGEEDLSILGFRE